MNTMPITLTIEEVRAALVAEMKGETRTTPRPERASIHQGDLLWVQEPWGLYQGAIVLGEESGRKIPGVRGAERLEGKEYQLRRADELPRNASRLTLEVTEVLGDDLICKVHKVNVDQFLASRKG